MESQYHKDPFGQGVGKKSFEIQSDSFNMGDILYRQDMIQCVIQECIEIYKYNLRCQNRQKPKVLDLGAGSGAMSSKILEKAGRFNLPISITAMEKSLQAFRNMLKMFEGLHSNNCLGRRSFLPIICDLSSHNFIADICELDTNLINSFDMAFASGLAFYLTLPQLDRFLYNTSSMLKPGGKLTFNNTHPYCFYTQFTRDPNRKSWIKTHRGIISADDWIDYDNILDEMYEQGLYMEQLSHTMLNQVLAHTNSAGETFYANIYTFSYPAYDVIFFKNGLEVESVEVKWVRKKHVDISPHFGNEYDYPAVIIYNLKKIREPFALNIPENHLSYMYTYGTEYNEELQRTYGLIPGDRRTIFPDRFIDQNYEGIQGDRFDRGWRILANEPIARILKNRPYKVACQSVGEAHLGYGGCFI